MRIQGGKVRDASKSTHPLAVALRKRGMSQRWLALETGVPPATVCRVLTGRENGFTSRQAEKIWKFVESWGDVTLESLVFSWR